MAISSFPAELSENMINLRDGRFKSPAWDYLALVRVPGNV
jgi:hypothetical protein